MPENANKKGNLVVISGPSGVGKSTICKEIVDRTDAFLSVSATTRSRGEGEVEGKNYYFLSRSEFEKKIQAGEFLEYAEVFGNLYGTPWGPVEKALDEGKTVLLEIDVQGGQKAKKLFKDAIMVFILPPKESELEKRMHGRARGEDRTSAEKRLQSAGNEIAQAWQSYDHMVINDDLEEAVTEIISIIEGKSGE
ncbi:Guanylate kinase [Anaerohalosphaera lusitana]|uniref:Guanylate kinase n=1 Tax=Anaerohalosphaera lusitana TaxID=1936003 RepID=A0A1U9NHI1_9BACT|nr:guanylate kinase [Anaerohalosphaera lusitana]AQT67218.1 Guanylate kinase [Anaerohalosphaera lusitana]